MAANSPQNNASKDRSLSIDLRQSLRNQILFGFFILVALLILIGGLALYTQARSARSLDSLVNIEGRSASLVLKIERQTATLRQIQTDYPFLFQELGSDVARSQYFEQWQELLDETVANLNEVEALSLERDGARENRMNLIRAQLNLYKIRFNYLVSLYELRGSIDSGLEGEVRGALEILQTEIEANPQLDPLNQSLLMLRGSENEFRLNSTVENAADFDASQLTMISELDALELSNQDTTQVRTLIDNYADTFRELRDVLIDIEEVQLRTGSAMDTATILLATETRGAEARQVAVQEDANSFGQIAQIAIPIAVVVASAFGVWLALRLANRIGDQAKNLVGVAESIGQGRYDTRAAVTSEDEFGVIAKSINRMLDTTVSLIQSDSERSQIQESIITLLEEASTVAEGDLTVQTEVRSDITGAIADSFNFMIEQLRDIIQNVQSTTLEVTTSANQIRSTAEMLAAGSQSQASQIVDTSAAIDEMSVSIQQVSNNASRSAIVGEQARENAQLGAQAVKATIGGMDRIRDEVAQTTDRLGRLEASSREIGKVTKVINDIAARTSILAINASIQASEAGDAGRGFAVVAQEVELLADRSSAASQQINRLVKIIQDETIEVSTAMTSTSREVSRGAHLATEAGQRLEEIETVSTQLQGLIQSISQASKQQARGSEAIAQSMQEIAVVTNRTATGTNEATTSIGKLAILANELRESVSQFKITNSESTEDR